MTPSIQEPITKIALVSSAHPVKVKTEDQLCYCSLCTWEGIAASEEQAADMIANHVHEKHTPKTYRRRFL